MKRWLPFPLLWVLLTAMWLLLNRTLEVGHVALGASLALAACFAFGRLEAPWSFPRDPTALARRTAAALRLGYLVLIDIVRSNLAVARIVLHPGTRNQTSGFLEIPLDLRHPYGLAALACIITATPGTAWARHDPARGILTIHVLDLIDEAAWIHTIKDRYERRLRDIFE